MRTLGEIIESAKDGNQGRVAQSEDGERIMFTRIEVRTCQACGGPVCPVCGGCISEGECSCEEEGNRRWYTVAEKLAALYDLHSKATRVGAELDDLLMAVDELMAAYDLWLN